MFKQGQTLVAKKAFAFKVAGNRGRAVNVKVGDKFWVTNSQLDQVRSNAITIDRINKGCISHGYAFTPETLVEYFA